jgi:3-phenylpropionate/trans-cinnamate dioxygenase ferredoxin subunit
VSESLTFTPGCHLDEVPEQGALAVVVAGVPVALARSEGTLYAIHDVCSHAEVALSDGEVEDGEIECWLHGSRFDLATGLPRSLPATQPVPVYPVRVEGDAVLVGLAAGD